VSVDVTTGGEVISDDMDGLEFEMEIEDEVEWVSSTEGDLDIPDELLLTAVRLMNDGAKQSIADGWMA
jgi:hypothetical protein